MNGQTAFDEQVAEALQLFQAADQASFPDVDWIVPDFVPVGGLVEIIGKVKKGKSTLAFQLARSLIRGEPFLGREIIDPSPVVLLTEQSGVSLKKTLERAGLLGERDLHLVTKPQLRRRPWAVTMAAAIEKAKAESARLIITDTLSRITMLGGDNENSSNAADIFDPCLPAREAGIANLFLRHARKGTPGIVEDGADMGRGSGAITGDMDITIRLRPVPGADLKELTWDSRISDDPEPLMLKYDAGRYQIVMADAGKPLDPNVETPESRLQKLAELEAQGVTGFAEQRKKLGWSKDTLAHYRKTRAAQRAAACNGRGV